jgi:hypothetical protein
MLCDELIGRLNFLGQGPVHVNDIIILSAHKINMGIAGLGWLHEQNIMVLLLFHRKKASDVFFPGQMVHSRSKVRGMIDDFWYDLTPGIPTLVDSPISSGNCTRLSNDKIDVIVTCRPGVSNSLTNVKSIAARQDENGQR